MVTFAPFVTFYKVAQVDIFFNLTFYGRFSFSMLNLEKISNNVLILQPLDYEKRKFDSLDPKDYGIEFEDEEFQYGKFVPPGYFLI